MKNNQQIWPSNDWQFISGNDTRGVSHTINVDVNEGDVIYFELNQNRNNYADETYWNPTITFN